MVIIMNGEKLKSIREEFEMTQNDMADVLGCTRSAYSLWEINRNTIPLNYLNKLSNALFINIDYLVGLSDKKIIDFKRMEIDRIELGKRIRIARKAANYSQEKLALKLNTTHSVISAYESGKTTIPTLFIIEISKTTKKSLNWFLNKL